MYVPAGDTLEWYLLLNILNRIIRMQTCARLNETGAATASAIFSALK